MNLTSLCGVAGLSAALFVQSVHALTVTAVTSDNGYPAHKVQWTDAAGLPRTAVLIDQNSTAPGPYTGYLRRYAYQVGGKTRTCTGTEDPATGGNLEFSGDGFVQNHTANGGDYSTGNGKGTPGTTAITLQGASHAVITFDIPGYKISGKTIPTTIQWFFADGRSHPVFAVSQDARATSGNLGADTRTPYGDMAYDGDGVDALVGGFSYGDTFKFVTLAANPQRVTSKSPWRATEANTVPYAMQWAEPAKADAEMGHVATLPISVSDAGQDTQTSQFDNPPDLFDPRNKSRPGGPLPPVNTWAYQILGYSLDKAGNPTDSKRLTWGGNFGRVGGFDNYGDTSLNPKQYSQHSTDPLNDPEDGTRASGLLMAYSTFIVLGPHAGGYLDGTVGKTVAQMENAARARLTAATGSVAASGPAGVGNASSATISYVPAGYNPTYAAWEIAAAGNAVDATLTPASGAAVERPVFLVTGYTAARLPASISVNGKSAVGTDYFATLDTASHRLWITANVTAASALHLVVGAASAEPQITSPDAASATEGSAFSYQITATGNPTSYGVLGLPPGLHVDGRTGLISGVPTVSGQKTLTLKAANANGVGTKDLALDIAPTAPVITSPDTAVGKVGVAFSYQITADYQPARFGVVGLRAGLHVNAVTGVISGTPTAAGRFHMTMSASNAAGQNTAPLTVTIAR